MAYESRIYLVDVHHMGEAKSGRVFFAETIAVFNLSSMGYGNGWSGLFTTPVDFGIYAENGNDKFCEDRYGDHLKSADFDKVIAWLESAEKRDHYRRIPPLLGILKGFDRREWEDLQIVHYGY